jgi:hypothetical protein
MSALTLIGALGAGAFIGAVLGFIGAGGAMLSVPILIYLFGFTPHQASTAALPIVFAAAAAGSISKFKSKDVLIKEATAIWGLGLSDKYWWLSNFTPPQRRHHSYWILARSLSCWRINAYQARYR